MVKVLRLGSDPSWRRRKGVVMRTRTIERGGMAAEVEALDAPGARAWVELPSLETVLPPLGRQLTLTPT